ncbi:MAG: hypothetical protein HY581_01340 [Nitrospirae bacterium]|nr:hypothetical protein [Nitrospirota bacterium]
MTALDEHERRALGQLVHLMEKESFESRPTVDERHVFRGPEGQIIVPVTLDAEKPSLPLAMLMAQKAEHLYKQTGCRFVLAQCPGKDPQKRMYLWAEGTWRLLP